MSFVRGVVPAVSFVADTNVWCVAELVCGLVCVEFFWILIVLLLGFCLDYDLVLLVFYIGDWLNDPEDVCKESW